MPNATFSIPRIHLLRAPEITVARAVLGLTLYLDEPQVWAREAAAAVLSLFLERVPRDRLQWFTTSMMPKWQRVGRNDLALVLNSLSTAWFQGRVRHLFEFRIADDTGAPSLGLQYREVDSARHRRTGFLEIILPEGHDPNELLKLMVEIGRRWPLWSAIGGYKASWNDRDRETSLGAVRPWCRRFLGLDLQDAERMSWYAQHGLPGVGWLTFCGNTLLEALPLDASEFRNWHWKNSIQVDFLERGVLVRAGEAPTLGDLNYFCYPYAYAEVAQRLGRYLIPQPPEFAAKGWRENNETARWWRRFIEPEGWR